MADHGSFHRAAEAMEVEQSTLSRNVLKLERLIGVKIFDRSHAGTTLTIAGRQFIRRARPMVACADKLASIMLKIHDYEKDVNLDVMMTMNDYLGNNHKNDDFPRFVLGHVFDEVTPETKKKTTPKKLTDTGFDIPKL